MNTSRYSTLHAAGLIAFLLVIWTGCGGGGGSPNGGGNPAPNANSGQPPSPTNLPDLAISKIEVLPEQPQAHEPFAVNVFVKNGGQAPSGEYDLLISIKDVSRQLTYPVGTFRNAGLRPGDNVAAYASTDRMVNDPGSFQVHVELRPFLFEDANDRNNVLIWAFSVK